MRLHCQRCKKAHHREGILRSAGYDSNGNVKPIKQYGLTRAEGSGTLKNNVAALRKCFYIINMAALKQTVHQKPSHPCTRRNPSKSQRSFGSRERQRRNDLGISNKDKKEFAQQMVRWVKTNMLSMTLKPCNKD